MREATAEELVRWNELVAANPDGGNVLQCRAFGEIKARYGWGAVYLRSSESEDRSSQKVMSDRTPHSELRTPELSVLVLTRSIPGLGELWYVPKGPGVANLEQLEEFISKIKNQKSNLFLVKVEPEMFRSQISAADMTKLGLMKAARDIQLNSATVIVDLNPSEDEIIALFKQKTRYNIRLAERHGVTVEPAELTAENIDVMYRLMKTTYERAGVYTRSKEYFEDFWQAHVKAGCGQLFFAKFEGEVQAAAFITYLGHKALYKDGASTRDRSDLQAPYLLQWEIMRWLKAHGVMEYDLHGTPPADRLEDKTHPLYSLARFKTGFNPEITEFIGTYDLPLDQAKYKLWTRFGERMAESYSFRVKKQLFY